MIYTFKEVLEDGVAPDVAFIQIMQSAKKGVFFQCVTISNQIDSDELIKGDKVLCSISIDELDEVKRLRERVAYLEKELRISGRQWAADTMARS